MPRSSALSAAAGLRIRRARSDLGISVRHLARRAGLKPALISGIERGSGSPTIGTLLRIAEALGVPVMDFVTDREGTRAPDLDGQLDDIGAADAAGKRGRPVELKGELERLGRGIVTLPREAGNKLRAVEAAAVTHAVTLARGNLSAASRMLGIERKALIRRWEHVRRTKKRAARGGAR